MGASGKGLKRFTEFWWRDRGFSALLLLLILVFFLSPFLDTWLAKIFLSIFLVLLLISGTAYTTTRRFPRLVSLVVATVALIFGVLRYFIESRLILGCSYISTAVFFFLLISVLLKQVFRDGPVTGHRIRGAIAAFLLIGITWAFIYESIAVFIPGAFSFSPSLTAAPGEPEHQSALAYYSFVTMTTLGYGDILPVHPAARLFAVIEALIGMLYPATLLARLVSLQIIYRTRRDDKESPDE